MTPLTTLPAGAKARVVSIDGERSFRCRLMELGLLPGTSVRVVRRVDVGGLVELEVRGCRLSLRQSEAGRLLVEGPEAGFQLGADGGPVNGRER